MEPEWELLHLLAKLNGQAAALGSKVAKRILVKVIQTRVSCSSSILYLCAAQVGHLRQRELSECTRRFGSRPFSSVLALFFCFARPYLKIEAKSSKARCSFLMFLAVFQCRLGLQEGLPALRQNKRRLDGGTVAF